MSLYAIQLECLLAVLAMSVLLGEAFCPARHARKTGYLLAVLVGVTFAYSWTMWPVKEPLFQGVYRLDAFALFFKRFFLAVTALALVASAEFSERLDGREAEFCAVQLLGAAGMLLAASANDFVLLFVAMELVGVSFYVLTGFLRKEPSSLEAGTKYLILGALSSGFMVYGIAYLLGTTGTTNFQKLAEVLQTRAITPSPAFVFGVVLVVAGLGFKIASVPFQFWVPDVYQGAPTPATAFLAVGSKATGFVLLMRVLWSGLGVSSAVWAPLAFGGCAASLVYGNLAAIPQRNIKRLLGYSSIGHAGYLLLGLAAGNRLGAEAVLFYLVQYGFNTLCTFLVIVAVSERSGGDEISAYAGLSKRSPLLALAMVLALASLAGVPPLSGFFGKLQLFAAVIERAQLDARFYWLAGLGAAGVVVSLYYYLNVARVMYMEEPVDCAALPVRGPVRIAVALCMMVMVGLGVYQRPLVDAGLHVAASLLGTR